MSHRYYLPPCSICQEPYHTCKFLATPDSCGHLFHYDCLNDWFKIKKNRDVSCPICRLICKKLVKVNLTYDKVVDESLAPNQSNELQEILRLRRSLSKLESSAAEADRTATIKSREASEAEEKLKIESERTSKLYNENLALKAKIEASNNQLQIFHMLSSNCGTDECTTVLENMSTKDQKRVLDALRGTIQSLQRELTAYKDSALEYRSKLSRLYGGNANESSVSTEPVALTAVARLKRRRNV